MQCHVLLVFFPPQFVLSEPVWLLNGQILRAFMCLAVLFTSRTANHCLSSRNWFHLVLDVATGNGGLVRDHVTLIGFHVAACGGFFGDQTKSACGCVGGENWQAAAERKQAGEQRCWSVHKGLFSQYPFGYLVTVPDV